MDSPAVWHFQGDKWIINLLHFKMCFLPNTRAVWEHSGICQKHGHAGKLRGQHSPVPGPVPAGRGGGQDGATASGAGSQRFLHFCRAAGRLHPLAGCCAGKLTAIKWWQLSMWR